MPTWNTSKPATGNSVAADVADIEENFDFLEDVVTYKYKVTPTTSATFAKDAVYYADPAAADQGATTNARSIASLLLAIGGTKRACIFLPHQAADGNTTTYTVTTAITSTSNITLIAEGGVIIAGAAALTVEGTLINFGTIEITGTVVIDSSAFLFDIGDITETGTLTNNGYRLTAAASVTAASVSDVNTGTNTSLYVTPDALAGSNLGTKTAELCLFPYGVTVTTGTDSAVMFIPAELDGMNLVSISGAVPTVSSSGAVTVSVRRIRGGDNDDMLTTSLTIDPSERTSFTAATPAVIDTSKDDVASGDLIALDVDGAGTGVTNGLWVALGFRLP